MDKHGKGITVKINGEERPFIMEKPTDAADMGAREIGATVDEEVALAPISFEQEKRLPKRSPFKRMLHARFKSAFFSILLAIIIGTSFGFIVLHIVPKQKETASSPASTISPVSSANETPTKQEAAEPLTVSVIQAGVFTDEKAAGAYAKQLQAAQIPVALVGKQPIAVWIGVGADKPSLAPLVEQFKQKGLTTYVKPIAVSSIQDKAVQALYGEMATLSVQLLAKNEIAEAQWTSLETQYKQTKAALPNDSQHMNNAYLSLIAYHEKKEVTLLWKVQQELLAALKKEVDSTR